MIENWKSVVGREGVYEVSDLGRVRSLDRVETYTRKDQYSGRDLIVARKHRGRILRPAANSSGHMTVVLGREAGTVSVHTLVLEAFVGPAPAGHECLHGLAGAAENALANIRWGTRSENLKDDYERGVRPSGESHPWAEGLHGATLVRVQKKEARNV